MSIIAQYAGPGEDVISAFAKLMNTHIQTTSAEPMGPSKSTDHTFFLQADKVEAPELRVWLKEYTGDHDFYPVTIPVKHNSSHLYFVLVFKNDQDALLFKMTW
jgi:hypothetical protein